MAANHVDTVRRAALPQVMLVDDVGIALRLSRGAARRAILRGECGPYIRVGRRLAVLRESFLAALASKQTGGAARGPRALGSDE